MVGKNEHPLLKAVIWIYIYDLLKQDLKTLSPMLASRLLYGAKTAKITKVSYLFTF